MNLNSKMVGRYKIDVSSKNGETLKTSGWFNNLITNNGKDRYGYYARNSLMSTCQVGTSNQTPAATDVSLITLLASTTSRTIVSQTTSTSPYSTSVVYQYTFPIGSVSGNIAEVGVGWGVSSSLFSRALIVDGGGNPTTLTVLSDEQLTVTYELVLLLPTVDATGQMVLDGITYTWTARAASASSWSVGAAFTEGEQTGVYYNQVAHDVAITGITTAPAGNTSAADSITSPTYVNGNYYVDHVVGFSPSAGNLAAGIASIVFRVGICYFQIGFSPVIPKTNTKTLTLTIRHSWS